MAAANVNDSPQNGNNMKRIPENVSGLWAKSDLIIWPSDYWIVAFDHSEKLNVLRWLVGIDGQDSYVSIIFDKHEISVIVADEHWQEQREKMPFRQEYGPLRGITFDVPLDIEVSGYLRPAIDRLADAGISVVPQCALIYDHIFVSAKDNQKAISVLKKLQREASTG